jgi:hypothetical protein
MSDNQVEFEFIANTGSIDSSLKKIEKSSEKTGKELDKNIGDGLEKRVSKSFKGIALAAAAAGVAIIAGIGVAFKKGVDAAIEQENAVNNLNRSLALAGSFSEEASKSFQAFASQIQRTTKIGDEAALNYLALSRNFARTNEEAKKLTTAAIDLAAATGVSVDNAVRRLGGSLGGVGGNLALVIPQMKELTQEQLKAGAAIDLVAKRFAGAAAAEVNTFSGRMTQAKNAFGDMLEVIGDMIIKSPAIVASIKFIRDTIETLTNQLTSLTSQGDPFKNIIIGAIDVADFFVMVLGPIVEIIIGSFKTLGTIIGGLAASVVQLMQGNFSVAAETVKWTFQEAGQAVVDTFEFSGTAAATGWINNFKETVQNAGPITQDIKNNLQGIQEESNKVNGITFEGFSNAFKDSANKIQISANSLAQTLNNSLVTGTSNAFASFGGALAKGENAFAAFGKSIISSIGQLLITFGTMLIAIGAGLSTVPFLFGLQGPAAIAAGVAATILGGALTALGGGGGGSIPSASAASGVGSSTGVVSPIDGVAGQLAETEDARPETAVTVNIQGNVLGDKRTLGREIAEALNDAFGNDGIIIARGAVS